MLPLVALLGVGPAGLETLEWVPPPPPPSLVAPIVASLHPRALAALTQMIEAAEQKLAASRCQEVFRDFHDAAGRPLERALEETGRNAVSLLRSLEFAEGSGDPACQSRSTLAWTHPGARTIYLCSLAFADAAHFNSRFLANLMIHEGLHTLGLGENPPSSLEITQQVALKCGY